MFYYPHHIGDYRSATTHLSNEEDLAYRRLLDMYYDTERPIPLDTQWVSRRIRVGADVVLLVLRDFFVETPEGWRSTRCDLEIAEYKAKAEIARSNGKKGGRPRTKQEPRQNPAGSDPVAIGNPAETGSKANQEPITSNQSTPTGVEKPRNARPPAMPKPEGVSDQTWADWLQLRKSKKAPVTETVLRHAETQAQKANLQLERFLQIWCARGSQGLEADWLKPSERGAERRPSVHSGFEHVDYRAGINDDGSFE